MPPWKRGEQHHRTKENDQVVELARQLHEEGLGYRRISAKLEVPISTVRDWLTYRTR